VEAEVSWLACSNSCQPGQAKLSLTITVANAGESSLPSSDAAKFANFPQLKQGNGQGSVFDKDFNLAPGADSKASIWFLYLQYLSLAFVGGLILNFMPCVLPVVSIKILSFVKEAGESRGTACNCLAYAAGTISTCPLWPL
jgi:thiol:disulfide interchange protein